MLNKIDNWLLDKPYQGIVEWSQKQPNWWVEQSCAAVFITAIMRFSMKEHTGYGPYLILGLDLLVCALFIGWSRVPSLMTVGLGGQRLRMLMLMLTAIGLFSSIQYPFGRWITESVYQVAFVSVYYFAACKPPRPRVPKTKTSLIPTT